MTIEPAHTEMIRVAVWISGALYIIFSVSASAASFIRNCCGDWSRELVGRATSRWRKLCLLVSPSRQMRFARSDVIHSRLANRPRSFIEPQSELAEDFDVALRTSQRLLLLGKSGIGKTTFALEMCRRYQNAGDAPAQLPVFITLSNLNRSVKDFGVLMDIISSNIGSNFSLYRKWLAKRMINEGLFLLIFDDLDFLPMEEHRALREMTEKWSKNSFVYLLSAESASYRKLAGFERISMPEWKREEGRTYLTKRFESQDVAEDLLQKLDAGRLTSFRTPLEWTCFADAYEEGRVFEMFQLEGSKAHLSSSEYDLLDHYLTGVLKIGTDNQDKAAKNLGRLALKLIKANRTSFREEELGPDLEKLYGIIPKIFQEKDGLLSFPHNTWQVLFAGKFIGKYWPEAEHDLKDDAAKALIWTAVYDCATRFITASQLPALRKRFHALAAH